MLDPVTLAVLAAVCLVVGVVAVRAGMRLLADRHLNPQGGFDNLSVTLLTLGVILIGWGTVGPVVYVLR